MENYFFFWKILFYLNRTKDFAKRMNCSCHTACADDNTQFIRSQSSQSKKFDFLTWPDIASASSTRDLGIKLSLTALFAVYVTDLVVDCKCLTEWLTELVTLQLPCLLLM